MLPTAILTLSLITGGCPNGGCKSCCDECNQRHFAAPGALLKALPHCIVGCASQNCYSCNRALFPGAAQFNYREDFNYPWSQAPCSLAHAPRGAIGPEGPEIVPTPQPSARKRGGGSRIASRGDGSVQVTDRPQREEPFQLTKFWRDVSPARSVPKNAP